MADMEPEVGTPPQRQRWATKGVVAGCIGLVVLFAVAQSPFARADKSRQLSEIVVTPPREECAKTTDNCMAQRCCKTTGYTCFLKEAGGDKATCMKECTPGVDGACIAQAVTAPATKSAYTLSSTNLFCFAVYTENTGCTKKSYDLELLRTNLFLGSHIFGCEAYKVYSDVTTWLSPGDVDTVMVTETAAAPFHGEKRKVTGTWINANMFIAVWKQIAVDNLYADKDWTVKADADAVFLPSRLRTKLMAQEVTSNGIYLENCKYVNFGFFGNLEVISHKAVQTYIANIDDCMSSLNYMGHEKLTGSEPWGEDLFAQRCMDLHGVDKVSDFTLTTDAACEAFRPEGEKKNKKWTPDCATTQTPAMHPFKNPKIYFDCLKATQR
jgi:hypothetical protein